MRSTPLAMLIALSVTSILTTPHAAYAGALDDVDRAASGDSGRARSSNSRAGRSKSPRSDDHSHYAVDGNDDSDGLFALAIYYLIASPWKVPRLFDVPCMEGYGPYPFHGAPRLLRRSATCDPDSEAEPSRRVAFDAELESGFLFEGVVPATFSVRAHLPKRFELSGRMSLLTDVYERPSQLATTAVAHVLYRHAQTSSVEFRTGIGVRLFALDVVRAGFDLMYAIDAYVRRRGVLRIELHVGSLGSALVGQARATVGLMARRAELYAGYDHTAFAGTASSASLGGPVGGVRVWF